MAMRLEIGNVVEHVSMGMDYRVLTLRLPGIAAAARPGQFIHLRLALLQDAVLRRPFSIYRAEGETLSILYKSVGRGTELMKSIAPGTDMSVMGPLGNGFPCPEDGRTPVLVAGGYGVAPLSFLAARTTRPGIVFIGGAKAADILLAEAFENLGWCVQVATEDGSRGTRGLITAPLDAWLKTGSAAEKPEFFACGPNGMLRAIGTRAVAAGYPAWLSLDRHMGCGAGACLACVQRIVRDRQEQLVRVCTEGPVFAARDVMWED